MQRTKQRGPSARAGEALCLFALILLFATAVRAQGLPSEALPEDLQSLEIQDHPIPSAAGQAGVIHALEGRVVVVRGDRGRAFFGTGGDGIHEGDTLYTLEGGRCRVRFLSDDVVTMAPETRFRVEASSDRREEGRKRSLFRMLKGKVMFYALRLFQHKETRVTLRTPTAVVGVRGTKFGVHVYRPGETGSSAGGIRVADLDPHPGRYLAQVSSGEGVAQVTDCFSEDGVVDVNGTPVGPGQIYRGQTGEVRPTPPGYVKAFESSTQVVAEGTGEESEDGEEENQAGGEDGEEGAEEEGDEEEESEDTASVVESGGEETPAERTEVAEAAVETTQQEVSTETETASPDLEISGGKISGVVSGIAMMLAKSTGEIWFSPGLPKLPTYLSDDPNPLPTRSGVHTAYMENLQDNEQYKAVLTEIDGSKARLDYLDWGYGGDISIDREFTYFEGNAYKDAVGHAYLRWGWWEDTSATDPGLIGKEGGSDFYAITAKIWHIEGDMTHPDYLDYLQRQGASYSYSGEVKGVYGQRGAAKTEHLSGPFRCDVNFGNRQVNHVDLQASGGDVSVRVKGSGTIGTDGTFDIENVSGDITVGGTAHALDADHSGGGGAFFGPKAQGVGGLWNANSENAEHWAAGEFHGKR